MRKPIKMGRARSAMNFPIKILIGTALSVDINPVIAAPIPAIWPMGSMAIALKFPNKKPMEKNCIPKKANST